MQTSTFAPTFATLLSPTWFKETVTPPPLDARATLAPQSAGQTAARSVGALLWEARHVEDLRELLDSLLADKDAETRAIQVRNELFGGDIPEFPNSDAFIARLAQRARDVRIVPSLHRALYIAAWTGQVSQAMEKTPPDKTEPASIYTLPVPFLDALLGHKRGLFCLAGLVDFALQSEARPNWLCVTLAEEWANGEFEILRLADSLAPGHVPEGVLPHDLRLDAKAIGVEHEKQHQVFEALIQKQSTAA